MRKTIFVLLSLSIFLYSGGNKAPVDMNSTTTDVFYGEVYDEVQIQGTDIDVYPEVELFDESVIYERHIDTDTNINGNELIQNSVIELGGDELGREIIYPKSDSFIDLRGFTFQNTSECKSLLLSGILEIKNKNLDYDKNQVFFRHGRITYVVPTTLSIKGKKCFIKKTKRGDILNMTKLMRYLGK